MQAIEAVKEFGGRVVYAIAIVDRGARENFKQASIPYFAFIDEPELLM